MSTMSTSSERITAAELERSKRARTIARNWLEAEETRMRLQGLDSATEGDGTPGVQMRSSKFGRPSPLERIKEAKIARLELKEFLKDDEPKSQPMPDPNRPIDALKELAAFGLRLGKPPSEIEEVVKRLTPIIVPLGSLAGGDSIARESVYARAFREQKFGFNEMIQTLNSINAMRPAAEKIDIPGMMNAMSSAMRTGAELASSKNNTADPLAMMKMITDNQAQSHQAQLAMYERLLETSQPRSLREQLTDLREVNDTFTKLGGKESETIQTRRLELDHEKWKANLDAETEKKKIAGQSELL